MRILLITYFLGLFSLVSAQKTLQATTSSGDQNIQFEKDSLDKKEASPLDIDDDRGLYILTKDGKMQLRILGSVRFSVLYDFNDYPIKKTFNTYYIKTGIDSRTVPSFYSSLDQSRLGFEVHRLVNDKNIFIRLESDFNGSNGSYRIRHAYGQMEHFLVGQTWSLFSNVSSLPPTVDGNGPTGSVTARTAQARYSGKNNRGTRWALALEYSRPDLNIDDITNTGLTTVQLFPDLTARIEREGIFGAVQLSGVLTTLSVRNDNNNSEISNRIGYGGSLSGTVDFTTQHKLLYQLTYGKSISHFITTFSGTGNDAIFNPTTNELEPLNSFGGFASYGFNWTKAISTNVSVGYADLNNKDFQPDDAYNNSASFSLDSFWTIIDGAKLGAEYVFGKRWDKSGTGGNASRIWLLFYYDF